MSPKTIIPWLTRVAGWPPSASPPRRTGRRTRPPVAARAVLSIAVGAAGCAVPLKYTPSPPQYSEPLTTLKLGVMDLDDHAGIGQEKVQLGGGYFLQDNPLQALSTATFQELRGSGMFPSVVHIVMPSEQLSTSWERIRWDYIDRRNIILASSLVDLKLDGCANAASAAYAAQLVDVKSRRKLWSVDGAKVACRLTDSEASASSSPQGMTRLMEKLMKAYAQDLMGRLAEHLGAKPSDRDKAAPPVADRIAAAPVAAPPRETPPARIGQKWAVVAGISDYKFGGKGGLTELQFADRDAKALAEFLRSPEGGSFEHVLELVNGEVTYAKLREALWNFLGKAIEEDLVLFYFSGHGSPDPHNRKNLYLMTHEADPDKMASTAFPMWDIETAIARQIKAERVIVITDACHGAGVTGSIGLKGLGKITNSVQDALLDLGKHTGKVCLVSCEAREESQESEKWGDGHGVFTHFLLQGLRGEADGTGAGCSDGVVTLGELIDYVEEGVRRETRSQQHPRAQGSFDRCMPIATVNK